MTLFLRNKENNTLLDLDVWVNKEDDHSCVEVSSGVDILNYSNLLITIEDAEKRKELIRDFSDLSELRGWLWERYFMTKKNTPEEIDNVVKELQEILNKVASKYDLHLVTD